jgi:branched-chain amino acid transport system substrate-binding protein
MSAPFEGSMSKLLDVLAFLLAIAVGSTSVVSAQPQPFTIDVILPLTGSSAFLGHDLAIALQVYERQVNRTGGVRGRPVRFAIVDDASDPATTVSLINQILARHPSVIIGPSGAGPCGAVAPLVAGGPVVYCLSPNFNPKSGSYVFASSVSSEYQVPVMVKYARLRGMRRLAFITATDASGMAADTLAQAAVTANARYGVQTVADERFAPTDINVAAQIARIKAAEPQAIFVWAVGGAFATVLQGLRDAGMSDAVVFTNPVNMNAQLLEKYSAFSTRELLSTGLRYQAAEQLRPGPLKEASAQFLAAYRDQGLAPTALSAYAWDPARIVVEALRSIGTDATPAQLRDYLESLHGFVGLNGVYDFRSGNQHGLTDTATIMMSWNARDRSFSAVSEAAGALPAGRR